MRITLLSVLAVALLIQLCTSADPTQEVVSSSKLVEWKDIRFVGGHNVLLITWTGEVYHSTDLGLNWADITSALAGAQTKGNEPGFLYPSPINPYHVYIRGDGSHSWISTDGGNRWKDVITERVYRNLLFHPTQEGWILGGINNELWLTQNFGETWTKVHFNTLDYDWGDSGSGNIPASRAYLLVPDTSSTMGDSELVYTDDFGATFHSVENRTYAFLFMEKQLFVLVRLLTQNKYVLKVTPDIGKTSKYFFEAEFPFGDQLEYNGYRILDDSTGAVMLGINHGRSNAHWGNIYTSDARGYRYSITIKHASMQFPLFDFERVQGLEGIYLVNTVENWKDDTTLKTEDQIISYITFDNGGFWSRLAAPHYDSTGKVITCTGTCSLHLHGYTSYLWNNFGPFYTTSNSLGIIVATGNVGDYLDHKVANARTYLSRDGGLTWNEIIQESTIYEIGDHGSIIVFAPYGRSTNTVYFTLTEGQGTLYSYQFSSQLVDVDNIITDPSSTNERFILLGTLATSSNSASQTVVFGLDFSKVFNRNCSSTDYEEWAPSQGKQQVSGLECLLGRDVKYRRRIANATCFNGEVEKVVSNMSCPCSNYDYECDYDYERDTSNPNQPCVLPAGTYPPTYPPDYCPPGTYYYKSTGYRKIAGDSCQGGLDLNGDGPYACPADQSSSTDASKSSSKGWIAAVILVPLVLLMIVGAFFALRSETLREKLPFLAALTSWKDGYMQAAGDNTLVDEDAFIEEEVMDEDPYSIGGEEFHPSSSTTTETTPSTTTPTSQSVNLIVDDMFDPRK